MKIYFKKLNKYQVQNGSMEVTTLSKFTITQYALMEISNMLFLNVRALRYGRTYPRFRRKKTWLINTYLVKRQF